MDGLKGKALNCFKYTEHNVRWPDGIASTMNIAIRH